MICIVSTHSPLSSGFGGIARTTGHYLAAFNKLRIPVELIASSASSNGKVSAAALRHAYPNVTPHLFTPTFSRRWGIGFGFLKFLPVIRRSSLLIVQSTRTFPTVIAGLTARAFRKKYYVVTHASTDVSLSKYTAAKRPVIYPLVLPFVLSSVRGAAALIVAGESEQRNLLPQLHAMSVIQIENFFEFDKSQVTSRHLQDDKTYLFAGRIAPDKGINSFCRAWIEAAGPTSRLLIAGTGRGTYFEEFVAIAMSDSRIKYLGELPEEKLRDVMENSSIVVVPTGLDHDVSESFGNVVVEAFIAGRPVMAAKGLHWDRYADNPAIIRFDRDKRSVQSAIRSFEMLAEGEYLGMSRSAAALAANFHLDAALEKLSALCNGLVANTETQASPSS